MSYDPAILLLGVYLEKTVIRKDTCTSTAALLTTAKPRKQPKCLLIGEQMKTMWCVYVGVYTYTLTHKGPLLSHKKEKKVISRKMDGLKAQRLPYEG